MRYKQAFMQNLQVFNSLPGFAIYIQDLGRLEFKRGNGLTQYAWALSQEYVENISATFITGIHWETRDQILDYLSNLTPQKEVEFQNQDWAKLCTVFDQAAEEVLGLLRQSWKRYVRSPYFAEFKMNEGASNASEREEQTGDGDQLAIETR